MSAICVECDSCRKAKGCAARPEMHRVTAFAWAHGADAPDCPFYEPLWHHGVEGVFSSPLPSLGFPSAQR